MTTPHSYEPPQRTAQDRAPKRSYDLENFMLNIVLFIAALLLIGAAALFINSVAPASIRVGALGLGSLLLYTAGLILYRFVSRLRLASYTFTGTGIALIPLTGVAAYTLLWPSGSAVWLLTSLIGTVAVIVACFIMPHRFMGYLVIAFLASDMLSLNQLMALGIFWYFVSLMVLATALSLILRFTPLDKIPGRVLHGLLDASRIFVPITALVAPFFMDRLTELELSLIFLLATFYVVALFTRPLPMDLYLQVRIYPVISALYLGLSAPEYRLSYSLLLSGIALLCSLLVIMNLAQAKKLQLATTKGWSWLGWNLRRDVGGSLAVAGLFFVLYGFSLAQANLPDFNYLQSGAQALINIVVLPGSLPLPASSLTALIWLSALYLARKQISAPATIILLCSFVFMSLLFAPLAHSPAMLIFGALLLLLLQKTYANYRVLMACIAGLLILLAFGILLWMFGGSNIWLMILGALAVAGASYLIYLSFGTSAAEGTTDNSVQPSQPTAYWLVAWFTVGAIFLTLLTAVASLPGTSLQLFISWGNTQVSLALYLAWLAFLLLGVALLKASVQTPHDSRYFVLPQSAAMLILLALVFSTLTSIRSVWIVTAALTLQALLTITPKEYRSAYLVLARILGPLTVALLLLDEAINLSVGSFVLIAVLILSVNGAVFALARPQTERHRLLGLLCIGAAAAIAFIGSLTLEQKWQVTACLLLPLGAGLVWEFKHADRVNRIITTLLTAWSLYNLSWIWLVSDSLVAAKIANLLLLPTVMSVLIGLAFAYIRPLSSDRRSQDHSSHSLMRNPEIAYSALGVATLFGLLAAIEQDMLYSVITIMVIGYGWAVALPRRLQLPMAIITTVFAAIRILAGLENISPTFLLVQMLVLACAIWAFFETKKEQQQGHSLALALIWVGISFQILTTLILLVSPADFTLGRRITLLLITLAVLGSAVFINKKSPALVLAVVLSLQVLRLSDGFNPLTLALAALVLISLVVWRLLARSESAPPGAVAAPPAPPQVAASQAPSWQPPQGADIKPYEK